MMYFGNRKPRGFHHTFMFVDERKELLQRLERQIAAGTESESAPEAAGRTLGKGSFRQGRGRTPLPLTASFGIMVVAVALLIIFLCILMNF